MRYMVRKGIQNWMVWDRKTHRPATVGKKLAVKLSKNEARELAAALNTLPADGPSFDPSQPATPLQPLRRRRKVKRSALRI
jgi:cytochrome c553